MNSLNNFLQSLSRYKYALVTAIGLLITVFIDENSLLRRWQYKSQIRDLRRDIEQYNATNEENLKKLHHLHEDPEYIKKIAREQYFMKSDDEDIFILSTDAPSLLPSVYERTD